MAQALYEKQPTPQEIAAAGLTPEDLGLNDTVEVWPENWPAVQLFRRIGNQWRVGAGGATGLDYNVLFHLMDRMNLDPDAWEDMFEDIQILESAALFAMHTRDD